MNSDQINRLKISFDDKVFLTDKSFKKEYNEFPWVKIGEGGEHIVYKYGEEFVIKEPIDMEENECYDTDETGEISGPGSPILGEWGDSDFLAGSPSRSEDSWGSYPSGSRRSSRASSRSDSSSSGSDSSSSRSDSSSSRSDSSSSRSDSSRIGFRFGTGSGSDNHTSRNSMGPGDSYTGEETLGKIRFDRFSLELGLPSSPFLTTSIAVSPNYSIEHAKDIDLDMFMVRNQDKPESIETRLKMCRNLYKALVVIFDSGHVHLDLKPENIFVKDGFLTIGDFGSLSRTETTNKHATRQWGLPKTSKRDAMAIDMYSMALIAIGIMSWNSSMIFKCRGFTTSLVKAPSHDGMCDAIGDLFTYTCMQEFGDMDPDLAEQLKCSILGKECDTSCAAHAYDVVKILNGLLE